MAKFIKSDPVAQELPLGLTYPKERFAKSPLRVQRDGVLTFLREYWKPIFNAGVDVTWETLMAIDYRAWTNLDIYLSKGKPIPEWIRYIDRGRPPKHKVERRPVVSLTGDEILSHPICSYRTDDFKLSPKILDALSGQPYIASVILIPEDEFPGTPGIGPGAIKQLKDILAIGGVGLGTILQGTPTQSLEDELDARRHTRAALLECARKSSWGEDPDRSKAEFEFYNRIQGFLNPVVVHEFSSARHNLLVGLEAHADDGVPEDVHILAARLMRESDHEKRCELGAQMLSQSPGLITALTESKRNIVVLCLLGIAPDGQRVPSVFSDQRETFRDYGRHLGLTTEINALLQRGISGLGYFVQDLPHYHKAARAFLTASPRVLNSLFGIQRHALGLCLLGETPDGGSVPPITSHARMSFQDYAKILNIREKSLKRSLGFGIRALKVPRHDPA
jgi:hypothetical protein